MTREGLLELLADLATDTDFESAHAQADDAIIEFIADPEIKKAFNKVGKWYA